MGFVQNENNGVVYMTAPVITARHAFSTRYGWVSSGDFSSLNLGFGRGDPDENVSANYRRLGAALSGVWIVLSIWRSGRRR